MASVGSITINLKADLAQFTQPFSAASKAVQHFASGVTNLAGKMLSFATSARGMIAGLTGIAGVAGLGMVAKRTMDSIDAIKKMGDRLGIATETMFEFKHAAELSGTSLDAVESSAEKLASAIGDALQTETSAAALAFKSLGINVRQLANMPIDSQLVSISDHLQRIRNFSERIDMVRAIFGRGGTELINLLGNGSKSLRDMMREAERLNLTLNATDAHEVERANDAITRVASSIQGHLRRAVVELSPYIAAIGDMLANAIGGAKDAMPSLISSLKDLAVRFGYLADAIAEAIAAAREYAPDRLWRNIHLGTARTLRWAGMPFLPGNRFDKWAESLEDRALRVQLGDMAGQRPSNLVSRFLDSVDREAAMRRPASQIVAGTPEWVNWVNSQVEMALSLGKVAESIKDVTTKAVSERRAGPLFAGALEYGSAEAYIAVLGATMRHRDPTDAQQLQELRKQTKVLEELLRNDQRMARKPEFAL